MGRENSIGAKHFGAGQKQGKLSRIDLMINEFSSTVAKLDREIAAEEDREIAAEEERVRVNDANHAAYSAYAKAAAQRRDNLLRTIEHLKQFRAGGGMTSSPATPDLENLGKSGRRPSPDQSPPMGNAILDVLPELPKQGEAGAISTAEIFRRLGVNKPTNTQRATLSRSLAQLANRGLVLRWDSPFFRQRKGYLWSKS